MDENPPDDPEVSSASKADGQGWPATALEQDKKNAFWKGGVMECFSTVLSLFSKSEINAAKEDEWDVPFSELSNFMYLGAGAQGIVFRSSLRGELVAVKKLRDRSEADIKHLQKLNHENIVRFRGVSLNGPVPCIIMEYCPNGPLFNYLHNGGKLDAAQTFRWAREIAEGMAYLHSHQIIHRDLKSPNILIAEPLKVKVSDFGTSKEFSTESTIMSFTGTVAWMAPEVIRHEPCSERVDVWSYGVVLWELLTREVPYKNLETHAIMWGVGTDTLSLPIPASCPESLQVLLNQCWRRIPRNRPPFRLIAESLANSGATFETYSPDVSLDDPEESAAEKTEADDGQARRKEELKNAREIRTLYEQQLNRANELYMEVCAVRLQLEQREKDLSEREVALKFCRCGIRKNLKYAQRQASSSSENVIINPIENERPRKKKELTTQVMVSFMEQAEKTVSVAVPHSDIDNTMNEMSESRADSVDNNNIATIKMKPPVKMNSKMNSTINIKNVVLEPNGNIVKKASKKSPNGNYMPDIAHV